MVVSILAPVSKERASGSQGAQAIPQPEEHTVPDLYESSNPVNAAGAWATDQKSPHHVKDTEFLLASNSASSARSRSRSHRLSTKFQRSAATIDNGEKKFVQDGAEEGPWNLEEQASVEDLTCFEQQAKPELLHDHVCSDDVDSLSFDPYLKAMLKKSQEKVQSIVAREKEEMIARLMAEVYTRMERCWNEKVTAAAAAETSSTRSTNQSVPSSGRNSGTKRKQNVQSRDPSPLEDPHEKRNRPNPIVETFGDGSHRMCCPIRKYDPTGEIIDASWSVACCGAGFFRISQVKEHLRRVHSAPIHCEKCWTTMHTDGELSNHTERGCSAREWEPGYWIRNSDMNSIMSSHGISWEGIFRIIFPYVLQIPSPYETSNLTISGLSNQPSVLVQPGFQAQFFTDISPRVEDFLENAISRITAPLLEELRALLPQIIREFQPANSRTVEPIELQRPEDDEIQPRPPLSVDETRSPSLEQPDSAESFQDVTGYTEFSEYFSEAYFDESFCGCPQSNQTDAEICLNCGLRRQC